MKNFSLILICFMMTALVLSGCGKKEEAEIKENDPAVVGTWAEDYFDSGYVFNSDDTGLDTFWNLSFTYTALDGVITITYDSDMYGIVKYDYTITGDTITMVRQDDETEAFEYKKQSAASRPNTTAPKTTTAAEDGSEETTDENAETQAEDDGDITEETTEG